MDFEFRWAEPEDVETVTRIIHETSGGLVDYMLSGIVPSTTPAQILYTQVVDEKSVFSYKNSYLCVDLDGEIIGVLHAYDWTEQKCSPLMESFLPPERLAAIKSLMDSADCDSLFINTFWVAASHRGTGVADLLMELAVGLALAKKFKRLSLHVWSENERAVNFYERHGFKEEKDFFFPESHYLKYGVRKLQLCKELD